MSLSFLGDIFLRLTWFNLTFQLVLMLGNFLNGNNFQGGAFGFRVSSINRVSLKSLSVSIINLSKPDQSWMVTLESKVGGYESYT